MAKRLFTSESVTEGHPDKICDQISDAVLDAILAQDPNGRVACETVTTTGLVMVMGEISTSCYVDIPGVVRRTVEEIPFVQKYEYVVINRTVESCADEIHAIVSASHARLERNLDHLENLRLQGMELNAR